MSKHIFISYSHYDDAEYSWMERLKSFLDGIKRQLPVKPWDDSMIPYGSDWRNEINKALASSAAAILLVGRGFVASSFINEEELPKLLPPGQEDRIPVYILHVGYSPWKHSVLARYQAFNNPDEPLEALEKHVQNKWFNDFVNTIKTDMDKLGEVKLSSFEPNDISKAINKVKEHLGITKTALQTTVKRLRLLVDAMTKRIDIKEHLQYEQFFIRYYDDMNDEEKFQFDQIRAVTEGVMFEGNQAIMDLLDQNPVLREELPILGSLKTHLTIWLNKYNKVFLKNEKMPVCFTGVEDGVPFPFGVDEAVDSWIESKA